MKNKIIYFFLIQFIGVNISLTKAQSLSEESSTTALEQLWQKAENNKHLQIQKMQFDIANAELAEAKDEKLPDLEINGEFAKISNFPIYENGLFGDAAHFPVIHTSYGAGAEAYYNIYDGHKSHFKIEEKKIGTIVQDLKVKQLRSDVKFEIASDYYILQRYIVFKDLLENDIAEQEKQLKKIEELKKNGVVLKSDVLRAQLQLSNEKLSLKTVENDIALANHKINILIGESENFKITPDKEFEEDFLLKDYSFYLEQALENAFSERLSEQEKDLIKLKLKSVQQSIFPKVGLFGNYKFSYPQIMFYPYSPFLYSFGMVGVQASFSLSGLLKNRHRVEAAAIEVIKQHTEHEDLIENLNLKVDNAYRRLEEAQNKVKVAEENVKQAQENLRIVNNTYFNQTSLITDLLDADSSLLQTKFELISAKITVKISYYQLQNIIGAL